jgi:hypothetical protein
MKTPKFMIVATRQEGDPAVNESVTKEYVLGQYGALELKDYQKTVEELKKLPKYEGMAFILRPVVSDSKEDSSAA